MSYYNVSLTHKAREFMGLNEIIRVNFDIFSHIYKGFRVYRWGI